MKRMRLSAFTRDFLLLFGGPIVWALHFLAIYAFTGLVCARPAWPQQPLLLWGIVGLTLLALAAAAAVLFLPVRRDTEDGGRFVRYVASALAWLSMLAIAWEAAALFLLPRCGVVT